MKRIFGLTLALTAMLAIATGISAAAAGGKFAHTDEITQNGSAIVRLEEGTLKRFESIDYQLDATAVATWVSPCGGQLMIHATFPSATIVLTPDDRGRVDGTLTLDLYPPGLMVCEVLQRIEYSNMTLTNLTTGHVYRLDPISRDFP